MQIYTFSTEKTPSLREVGGKAKSLISSTQAGLPVPGGLALTVAFFQPWTDRIKETPEWKALLASPVKESCDKVKQIAENLTLTDGQRSELEKAMAELSDTSVFAVRSSSPEEDLEGSSFAGMYETFLGTTRDQLETTIAKAYSSMLDFRVMEYKAQNNINLEGTCISVVVQKQIASDVSGVGFSLNPLNNCYDEAVINASFGLGEAIVSGIVTPDNYVVEKVKMEILEKSVNDKKIALHLAANGGIEQKDNSNPGAQALTDSQILELTDLIKKCENHYNLPIDTEWAYEKGKLYLLQARPITTYVPLFPEMITKPGERKKLYLDLIALTQGFDAPLSVLGSDIWSMVMNYLKQGTFPAGEGGYLLNMPGRQYIQLHIIFKGLGKKVGMKIPTQYDNAIVGREEEIFNEYVNLEKTDLIKQGKKAQLGLIKALLPFMVKTIFNPSKGAAEMNAVSGELTKLFKNLKNDSPFDELVTSTFESYGGVVTRMSVYLSGVISQGKIRKMMKGTAAEELVDSLVMDLASNPTSAMGHAMFALASFRDIQDTADAAEFEQKITDRSYSEEFMAAWDDYVYKYGDRGFKEIDVASPRLEEKLDEFYLQLKTINLDDNQMKHVAERKEDALNKMRAVAGKKGKLKAFDKAVDVINLTYGLRETPKYLVVIMNGGLRKVALEIADQFVAQGRLEHRDQIFDLHKEQIGLAQRDHSLKLPLIEENLKPYKQMKKVKQFPNFIDSRGKIFRNVIKAEEGDLAGMAVSNGVIKGKAKVLATPYEKPLEPGEILVTVATEPAWTPVFSNASGVVLEVGGGLQHGAIIAREYGLPCVSGLPGVTEIIKDGDMLEVDGTNGIVKILQEFDMKCDLHIHSIYGTGNQSLEEIVQEALSKDIRFISITDDDTMDAYDELADVASRHGVSYIKGMQVSASYKGRLFRPLAYDCDPAHPGLQELLEENRRLWDDLGGRVIGVLVKDHPELSVEEYTAHQQDKTLGGFKHSSYLYSKGLDGSDDAATKLFLRYREEMTAIMTDLPFRPVEEVIRIIHKADGRAVIPGGYLRNLETLEADMETITAMGVDGAECFSASYNDETAKLVLDYARKHKLLITGGGDGHGTWADQEKRAIGIREIDDRDLNLGDIRIYS